MSEGISPRFNSGIPSDPETNRFFMDRMMSWHSLDSKGNVVTVGCDSPECLPQICSFDVSKMTRTDFIKAAHEVIWNDLLSVTSEQRKDRRLLDINYFIQQYDYDPDKNDDVEIGATIAIYMPEFTDTPYFRSMLFSEIENELIKGDIGLDEQDVNEGEPYRGLVCYLEHLFKPDEDNNIFEAAGLELIKV